MNYLTKLFSLICLLVASYACTHKNNTNDISTQTKDNSCQNYRIVKNSDDTWELYQKESSGAEKKLFSSKPQKAFASVTEVACDQLVQNHSRIRVSTYSGGAHCCTTTYWLPETDAEPVLYFNFGNSELPANSIKNDFFDKNGNLVRELIDVDTTAYFSTSDFGIPFASSPALPLYLCYQDNYFIDCTSDFADKIEERIATVKSQLVPYDSSLDSAQDYPAIVELVEYIGLNLLLHRGYYWQTLNKLGIPEKLYNAIEEEMSERLYINRRNEKYPVEKMNRAQILKYLSEYPEVDE